MAQQVDKQIDIRKARVGNLNDGTIPPQNLTGQKQGKPIPDIDSNGTVTAQFASEYDGDPVIATYMEFLKQHNITEDDIYSVLDALLTSNSVSFSFTLFEKVPVVFQAREAWVDDYIVEILDDMAANTARVSNVRYNNTVAECNLAASMVQYKDERYVINDKKDLDEARKRIQKLPYVIQNALVKKLAVFDRTLAVATSDWAVKNFTKPRQESSEPGQS